MPVGSGSSANLLTDIPDILHKLSEFMRVDYNGPLLEILERVVRDTGVNPVGKHLKGFDPILRGAVHFRKELLGQQPVLGEQP